MESMEDWAEGRVRSTQALGVSVRAADGVVVDGEGGRERVSAPTPWRRIMRSPSGILCLGLVRSC